MSTVYLSTAYLAPVQYYSKLVSYDSVMMEACESYQKQTYRNRCLIATANGVQSLTIPVEKPKTRNPPMSEFELSIVNCKLSIINCQLSIVKDVQISNHGNWRHVHWQALVSAYGKSPFFAYYQDDFAPFYEKRYRFLFDFNEQLRLMICQLLDIQTPVSQTVEYAHDVPNDFRENIRPRHPGIDDTFVPQPYYQVFQAKHGFLPNLSIVDLLFNMGPEAIIILR